MASILNRAFFFGNGSEIASIAEEPSVMTEEEHIASPALEVDYDTNMTSLYKAITESDWDAAIAKADRERERERRIARIRGGVSREIERL